MRLRLPPVALLLAVLVSACGGSSSTGGDSPPPVGSVTVVLASPSLGAGLGTTATATLRDGSGNVLTGRTVTWSSSAPSVATVSGAGVVTALVPGTAAITARSEGQTGQAGLTVTVNPVQTVTVTLANANLSQGSTTQATATVRDAAGNALSGREVAWSSAATGVASVTAGGAVTAVGPGAVLITATCEGKSGQAVVNVAAVPVASVTAILTSPRVGVGQVSQATAVLRDAAGSTLSGRTVTWASSAPAIATITNTGVVTAVGLGSATLTATALADGVIGQATLTVTAMYAVTALSQTGPPGLPVTQAPAVKVTDGAGAPLAGVPVAFAVVSGGGGVAGSPVNTDANGVARLASWTFGGAGAQAVTASAASLPGVTVEFGGLSRLASVGYDITLRPAPGMTDSQLRAFVDAKERIQELVIGEVTDIDVDFPAGSVEACGGAALKTRVDDVIIFAEIRTIDGGGDASGNILGQAGPCSTRGATLTLPGFPATGHMQFDIYDVPAMEANGTFGKVVLHEMMHVLGFGTLWSLTTFLKGAGTTQPYFSGPSALSAFDTYNGGGTYPGSKVPVEDTGGAGTANAHWREADLDDELMTGFLDRGVPALFSATTVKSMEDLGYGVDASRADPFRWGTATVALRALLRDAGLGPVEPPIHLFDDVRRIPPVTLGPDGKPLFP